MSVIIRAFVAELSGPVARRGNVAFDGIAYGAGHDPVIRLDGATPEPRVENADIHAGEWMRIDAHADGSLVVQTDHFGFYPLYYTSQDLNDRSVVAVSNDFTALLDFLKKKGVQPQLDVAACVPTIYSGHRFLRQIFTDRTPCRQIRRLGADEHLHVAEAAVVRKRPGYLEGDGATTYEEHLRLGFDGSVAIMRRLHAFTGEPALIHLSGGRDSRACLAMMLQALPVEAIRCIGADPRLSAKQGLWDDIHLATELVRRSGAEWWMPAEPEISSPALDLDDHIRHWRILRGGSAFVAKLQPWTRDPGTPRLTIRGGGGENLRTFWAKFAPKDSVGPSRRAEVKQVYRNVMRRSPAVPRLVEEAAPTFVEAVLALPGKTVAEKLDNHYLYYRSRTHFGHLRASWLAGGDLTFHPLCNPHFLHGSRRLSHADRAEGQTVFDIIEAGGAWLNDVPFESGPWPERLWKRRGRDGGEDLMGPRDSRQYFAFLDTVAAREAEREEQTQRIAAVLDESVRDRVRTNLGLLKEAFDDDFASFDVESASHDDRVTLMLRTELAADVLRDHHPPYDEIRIGGQGSVAPPA
jgi:hypothetical protein